MIKDCAIYVVYKLIPEVHNQQEHDLFIGEVLATWTDDWVFPNRHWKCDDVIDEVKSLHSVTDG